MPIKFSKIINIAAFPWWYLCNKPIKMQLGFTRYTRGSWLLLPCNAESHQVCWRRQNHGATAPPPGFLSPSAELMLSLMTWPKCLCWIWRVQEGAKPFVTEIVPVLVIGLIWRIFLLEIGTPPTSIFVSPRLNTRQPAVYFDVWGSAKAWKYMH